jgi:hypothetical protein
MRRILMLLCCATLLLALAVPAVATPVSELTALARFFPDKTVIFASIRTDDEFFSTIDSLVTIVREYVSGVPAWTVEQALDEAVSDLLGTNDVTFNDTIRPWLGDTAAIGFPSSQELFDDDTYDDIEASWMFAADITDREAAEAFFEDLIPAEADLSVERIPDYTLFTDDDGTGAIYFGNEVLLITNDTALLPQDTIRSVLSESEDFNNSLNDLPETDYDAITYINLQEFFSRLPLSEMDDDEAEIFAALASFYQSIGSQVWGATVLDGRSMTLDIVQQIADPAAYEAALGMPLPTEYMPVNFDFARFIPAGTPFVAMSTNLHQAYENMLLSLNTMANMQTDLLPEGAPSPSEEIEQGLAQLEFAIRSATGLDLEDDILSWMTGNYAFTLGFSPEIAEIQSIEDTLSEFPIDFGLLVEVTDPAAAQAVVDGMAQALGTFSGSDFTLTEEEIGDVTAQVITIPPSGSPFPIEIIFGASDEVFAIATPRVAEAAFNPSEGLTSDPAYMEMQEFVLDEPMSVFYLAGEGLTPLVNLLVITDSVNAWDKDAITDVFRLLSSSSISTVIQEDGTTIIRMVLTLPG